MHPTYQTHIAHTGMRRISDALAVTRGIEKGVFLSPEWLAIREWTTACFGGH